MVSLNEASKRLDTTTYVVRQLIKKGLIKAKPIIAYAPFEIEISEIEKALVKEAVQHLKCGRRLKNIANIDDGQLNLF